MPSPTATRLRRCKLLKERKKKKKKTATPEVARRKKFVVSSDLSVLFFSGWIGGGRAFHKAFTIAGHWRNPEESKARLCACRILPMANLIHRQANFTRAQFHEAAAALTAPAADGVTFSSSLDSAPPMLISLHQRAREYCKALEPPRIEAGGSFFTCPPPRRPPDANARSSRCDCRCRTPALVGSATRLAESSHAS